ncbi:putative leader peptide [Streptomyces sp. NPDC048623]|uniref:putative leader peptide n=1 Tax=Streptomyces sp. NPDC048623 TaxID=3155761 RepID=UPI00342D7BB9
MPERAAGPGPSGTSNGRTEVTVSSPVFAFLFLFPFSDSRVLVPAVAVLVARGCVRLYSRPHIDLQRVAGALCRS